ncbi:CYTH domain-containing protein [Microbulbifer sp. EKSA008]|uniref:CYTH domain-containing protein n=1 Tax=unclassified Microbulbifer TaxID=2619833 RepID=UPI004039A71F
MAKEIERKFLVDEKSIASFTGGKRIKQAYVSTESKAVVRVRVIGDRAYLTLKGESKGITRTEFEYPIPFEDANEMIAELCDGPLIDKTRFIVEHEKHTWEIDIFHGDNDGLIVAEVEMQSESESVVLPEWIDKEVTGDPKYYNSNLLDFPFKDWDKS